MTPNIEIAGDFGQLLGYVSSRVFDVIGYRTFVYPGHGNDTSHSGYFEGIKHPTHQVPPGWHLCPPGVTDR